MSRYFELHDKVIKNPVVVILLLDLARQRGIHPDKLLKGTKLFQHDLIKTQFSLAPAQFSQLIYNAIKLIDSPDLPFLLGNRLFPSQLGKIGSALMNTSNLQDMLRIIKCYQQQLFPFMFAIEKRHNDRHYFLFNHAISHEKPSYQLFLCELLASMLISAIKWRSGHLPELTIRFPYAAPAHIEQYQAYLPERYRFSPQITSGRFGQSTEQQLPLQVSIKRTVMHQVFAESNPVLKRHLLNQIPRQQLQVGLIQFVLQTLEQHFIQGKNVSLEAMAAILKISPATLKRKLLAHNTSYQKLLDLYRKQAAIFQITEQGFNNEKVASSLSFSDITNFRRSFKRWTGVSPNELKLAFQAING